MKRLAMICLPALLAAACSSTRLNPAPVSSEAAPAPVAAAPAAPAAQPPASSPVKPVDLTSGEATMSRFQRDASALDRDSIFFAYDKSTVPASSEGLIQRHDKALNIYPKDHLVLQGNCDERGGAEYNLALGQRRADAVKERLVLLGAPVQRLETVSFGKEKPRETCHEESCWSENRRVDFVDRWQ